MNDTSLQQKRLIAAAIDLGIGVALCVALWIVYLLLFFVLKLTVGFGALGYYVPRFLSLLMSGVILAYVLCRDLLGEGRSLGKKTQDLKVVTASGGPIEPIDSIRRNAIFALGPALGVVSSLVGLVPFLGWFFQLLMIPLLLLAGLSSIGVAAVELVKITQDPAGIRLGDQFARTKVLRS